MKSTIKVLILALCFGTMSGVVWGQTTDDFRTHQNGGWHDSATWERYNGLFWEWPSRAPSSADGLIRILSGHTVTISGANVTADQLTVDGTLRVSSGRVLTIANGPGVDLVTNSASASVWIDGTLVNNGTIQINLGALKIGTIINNGDIEIGGIFQFDHGTITGNDLRYGPTGSAVIGFPGYTVDQNNQLWPSANGPANVTVSGNVTLNGTRTVSGSFIVSGTLQVAGAGVLTTEGTTEVSGTLHVVGMYTNIGTMQVAGTLQVTGTFINNGTTQIAGTFQINPGGAVNGNGFVYTGCCNKLVFNGSFSIESGTAFWPSTNGPANVIVQSAASVTLNATRTVSDSLEVFGTLHVAEALTTNGTRIEGTLHVAGTLTTNGVTQVYGTLFVAGTLTNNGTTQILGKCQVTGTLTNNGTTQIDGTLQFDQGGSSNGSDFTYGTFSGTLVFNNSSGSYEVNSGDVYWPSTNGPARVIVQGAGGITMNVARTVTDLFQTAAGVTNGHNLTLSGTVQIQAGGFFGSSPIYSGFATLIYNTGDSYDVSAEWESGTSVGSGVPMNVEISNGTTVNMPSSARTCPGNLSISGTLVLSTTVGADLSVGGNWYNFGTLIPNSRAVIFNGATEQFIDGVTTFDYLTVNNSAGISLQGGEGDADSVTVNQTLSFITGNLRLASYIYGSFLILSGAVSDASITHHVVTYDGGFVIRSIAGGDSFQFPVGPTETSYNPLTIALDPADPTETFSARVDSTVNPGAPDDSLCVQRTWDIREATGGDNHAALTFQWAGAEEGAKFTRNVSSTYHHDGGGYVEVVSNGEVSGTDPYIVSTTGGFPCTEFSPYVVGRSGGLTLEEAIAGLVATNDSPTPLDSVTTFTATVTTGSNVRYMWSFGDGKVDSGEVVTHTYAAPGDYTAFVTATNSLGSATDTTAVNIFIASIAGLKASNDGPTRLGNATTLTATVTEGSRVSYSWNFGDGTPVDSGAVVNHTYSAIGVYMAVVTATNAVSTLTDTTNVTVIPTTAVKDKEFENRIPTAFTMSQNYPNPFWSGASSRFAGNPSTTFRYALPRAEYVTLTVYNLLGKEIEKLVSEKQLVGEYTVRWNPVGLPSGVYVYRLQAGEFVATKKLILLQ